MFRNGNSVKPEFWDFWIKRLVKFWEFREELPNNLAFKDKDFTENILYNKLLNDKLSSNLGYLYENIVAQMLVCSGNKLFYHTWPTESGKHNYEIDFLLSRGTKIVPVEVKSSTYKTHVSMDEFYKKFSSRIANDRYLVYTKDYFKEGAMKYLPAYLAYFL